MLPAMLPRSLPTPSSRFSVLSTAFDQLTVMTDKGDTGSRTATATGSFAQRSSQTCPPRERPSSIPPTGRTSGVRLNHVVQFF